MRKPALLRAAAYALLFFIAAVSYGNILAFLWIGFLGHMLIRSYHWWFSMYGTFEDRQQVAEWLVARQEALEELEVYENPLDIRAEDR